MSLLSVVVLVYALGSLVLSGIYTLLYRDEKNSCLKKLKVSWLLHFCGLILYLLFINLSNLKVLLFASHLCVLFAATTLWQGMADLVERKLNICTNCLASIILSWLVIASFMQVPVWLVSLPLYILVSTVYIWSGTILLMAKDLARSGRFFLGTVFIVWGIHKINYPVVHYLPEFKIYGFLMAMIFLFLAAIGTLIVYFKKVRYDYSSSQHDWEISKKYYESYFMYSPLAIVVVNNIGVVVDINPQSEDYVGYDRNEIIGTNCMSYIAPENKSSVQKEWLSLLTQGSAYAEAWIMRKDGVKRFAAISSVRINNERLAIFLTDLTQSKISSMQLEGALDKAKESDKLKAAFLATMSHEIRTPLNAVVGFTDLVLEEGVSEEQNTYLNNVKNSANFLVKTIDDILEISKLDTTEVYAKEEPIFLNKLIDDISARIELMVKQEGKKIAVLRTIDAGVSDLIYGDRTKIEQILGNLLHNAFKFTDEGSIELVVNLVNDERISFAVKDTGIGISQADQEIVFDEFKQVDMSDTRGYGGMGLGLSVSKKLAKVLKGQIDLESQRGINHGSTFSLIIPYMADDFDDSELSESPKIMVVEDDPVCLKLMQGIFSSYDYELISAKNGQEAWNNFMKFSSIKLIVMDMQMPIMDGFATIKKIRNYELENAKERVPIIALTAMAMQGDKERCLELGCDVYLTKPIQYELFDESVRMYLK